MACWRASKATPQEALAGATPYLRLFGHAVGGCLLADEALAARRLDTGDDAGRTAIARFFAEAIASAAPGLETTVVESADSITAADAVLGALAQHTSQRLKFRLNIFAAQLQRRRQ